MLLNGQVRIAKADGRRLWIIAQRKEFARREEEAVARTELDCIRHAINSQPAATAANHSESGGFSERDPVRLEPRPMCIGLNPAVRETPRSRGLNAPLKGRADLHGPKDVGERIHLAG